MTDNTTANIQKALSAVFSEEEAGNLARLLASVNPDDTLYYESIDLPAEKKDEYILMAFEERLLIPYASRPGSGSAWEDSMLTMAPGTLYIMPRVIRELVFEAASKGALDAEKAIRKVLREKEENLAARLLFFFLAIKPHAVGYKVEAGLMNTLNQGTGDPLDLHETLDLFALLGIMSPCTRGPIHNGLLWYEINPALCW